MGVCREVEYNEPDLVTVAMTYSNEGQYITSNKWININAIDVIHAESFRQSWQGIEKESREWEKFHLFLIGRGTFPRQINTWSLRMRSCTAQKGKMKKQWLKKIKQTNNKNLLDLSQSRPECSSQNSTYANFSGSNISCNNGSKLQEGHAGMFLHLMCFHVKGVLFVLYHLLSCLRISVDWRESNSYRSVSDAPFPQHNLTKNHLFTHDMNGTQKERTEGSQSSQSLSLLQLWDLPGKCRDLKQTTHRAMCCGAFCLKQTCTVNSHSLSSEKEDVFITYWLSWKPGIMKPKPLTLRLLSKAPTVFPPRSEAESLHRGPCSSFQSLMWLQSWGEDIRSSHLSNLASKTVSTSWRTDGMYFKAATWVEHEINLSDAHIPHLCCWARPFVTTRQIRERPCIPDSSIIIKAPGATHSFVHTREFTGEEDGSSSKQVPTQI